MLGKAKEKSRKLVEYTKLEMMFRRPNEFSRVHPELVDLWKKKFRQMIRYSSDRVFPIVEEFLSVEICKVSQRELSVSDNRKPILVCALKNDLQKMKHFMQHYRKLGIENFVFVDNNSNDGTFEFLMDQPDAIVYRCLHPFTADRKIAWVNRVLAELGTNRWYIFVDSDEFLTYVGYSEHAITDVVDCAERNHYKRIGGVMLDMYPKGNLFSEDSQNDFVENYCFFDKNTYRYGKTTNGMRIVGGPRARVLGIEMKLSKYMLVYFEDDDVVPSAHFFMPLEKSYGVPVWFGVLHYKFMNKSDYEKMVEAVETGMHSDNSREYRKYYEVLSENPELSFYDEKHSVRFSEKNLLEVDFMEEPDFKN